MKTQLYWSFTDTLKRTGISDDALKKAIKSGFVSETAKGKYQPAPTLLGLIKYLSSFKDEREKDWTAIRRQAATQLRGFDPMIEDVAATFDDFLEAWRELPIEVTKEGERDFWCLLLRGYHFLTGEEIGRELQKHLTAHRHKTTALAKLTLEEKAALGL